MPSQKVMVTRTSLQTLLDGEEGDDDELKEMEEDEPKEDSEPKEGEKNEQTSTKSGSKSEHASKAAKDKGPLFVKPAVVILCNLRLPEEKDSKRSDLRKAMDALPKDVQKQI
eukprot:8182132-Pyramimonas_sp.AAC.1